MEIMMIKNTLLQMSLVASLATISLPVYAHNSEITHSHFNAELIALLLVVAVIAIGLIKK
jgi:hypothetical protein